MKKLAALIEEEECDLETSEKIRSAENKTVALIKKIKNCKPFISVSILFLCISILLTGVMIYFYLKSKNNNFLPKQFVFFNINILNFLKVSITRSDLN